MLTAMNASQAKQKFGILMDMAIKKPILIEKYGRPYVVLISKEYYDFLIESQGEMKNDDQ